jgi:hypothetical protein
MKEIQQDSWTEYGTKLVLQIVEVPKLLCVAHMFHLLN